MTVAQRIPAKQEGASRQESGGGPIQGAERLRVLVIDDDAFVIATLAAQLRGLGIIDIVTVSESPKAVCMLNQAPLFDLIVTDLSLPEIDGIQLLRLVHVRQSQAAVILISSFNEKLLATAEDLARSRGLRVLGALHKPVPTFQLRLLIARALEGERKPVAQTECPEFSSADLRRAIAADEIKVFVQPQLDCKTGVLEGVEALARWVSPEHGIIPPYRFIGLAERSGLIDEITELMLRRSIISCGAWKRFGLLSRISVNAPISSLCSLSLPDTISDLIKSSGLDTEQLVIEVTESGFMQDRVRSLDVLTRLRLRGVGLAIDDFGCGYSSLQQLKRVPFTELKIDCSFVMSMLSDAASYSIVKSSLGLARDLGMRSVAEGVESRAHWEALARLGCDVVQGYHVARPFPVEQLPRWLEKSAAEFRR